jgi:hypothetical protein
MIDDRMTTQEKLLTEILIELRKLTTKDIEVIKEKAEKKEVVKVENKTIDDMTRSELLALAKDFKDKLPNRYITLKTDELREELRRLKA